MRTRRQHSTCNRPSRWNHAVVTPPQAQTSFDQRLKELVDYKKAHGHCRVPQKYAHNQSLGWWVSRMRKFFKTRGDTYLTKQRIKKLNKLGFEWDVARSTNKAAWQSQITHLKHYKEKHGHCRVPFLYQKDRALASFVHRMRNEFKKQQNNGKSALTPERISDLNKIGFDWEVKIPVETIWHSRLEDLKEFQNAHGHCRVPPSCTNKKLAYWVSTRRKEFKRHQAGEKCALTIEHIKELDDLGFDWDPGPAGGGGRKVGAGARTRRLQRKRAKASSLPGTSEGDMAESDVESLDENKKSDEIRGSGRKRKSPSRYIEESEGVSGQERHKGARRQLYSKVSDDCAIKNGDDSSEEYNEIEPEHEESERHPSETHITRQLDREDLIFYFTNQLDRARKENKAVKSLLQQSKDENKLLCEANENLKQENKLLCDVNIDLTKCNKTLRASHQTAMKQERGNLQEEIKKRKLFEGRYEKVKQLVDFELDETCF
ncbi:MAG: hypothetical protein SGBAC_009856 [Bacillariaceae sp.]